MICRFEHLDPTASIGTRTDNLFDPERESWLRVGATEWRSPGRNPWWCRLDGVGLQLSESELFDCLTYDGDVLTRDIALAIITQNGGTID